MKGLTKEGTRPYSWQSAIPKHARPLFEGQQKFVRSMKTHDYDEAVRRAILVKREFEEKCGTGANLIQIDIAAVAGLLFEDIMHRPDAMTPREAVVKGLARHKRNEHPLLKDFPDAGPTFDRMAEIAEQMWRASAMSLPDLRHKVTRKSFTLEEQAEVWRKTKPSLTAKTIDQYVHDVKVFCRWYEGSRNDLALGSAITKRDVNDYIAHRMQENEPYNTIMRRLSSLKKVYKSGQFSDDNPFHGVSGRIDIDGPEKEVRPFTDAEVRHLFKEMKEFDLNVQWVTRIAAYTGMRLAEICSFRIEEVKWVMNGKAKIWYLSFQKQPWRRPKTKGSYRDVPVHSSLVPDLLKFIKGRSGWLLDESDQNKYKSRSAAMSQRMGRLIDRVCADPEVVEHSFRHTVITKLANAGVLEEIRKKLAGHVGGAAHDGYNHAKRIRALSEAVETIAY